MKQRTSGLLRLLALLAPLVLLGANAFAQTYQYDAAGRLTRVTYAGGTTISYVYDAAGNITTVNTTPQPPSSGGGGGGGCFIATAAYGSPIHPHVQALREFRDGVLLGCAPGRAFVAWYARVSPPLAALIAEHPSLRAPVRWALAPIVYTVAFPRTASGLGLLLVLAAYLAWKRRRRMVGPSFGEEARQR